MKIGFMHRGKRYSNSVGTYGMDFAIARPSRLFRQPSRADVRTHMKCLVKALQFLSVAGDDFWLLIHSLGGLTGHADAEP